jgi:uncharacterized membrane protein (UPF0127 family)
MKIGHIKFIKSLSNFATRIGLLFALLISLSIAMDKSFAAGSNDGVLTPIIASTSKGEFVYNIELAVSGEQRTRGLMFRKTMPQDYGMLFDFDKTQKVMMWMKNTYLPLDMIFLRVDGTIAHIVENTSPLSLKIVSSRFPVRYVLELNAGEVARAGMKPGQILKHFIFLKRGG